jgi:uncharacterized protein (DUF169 family)
MTLTQNDLALLDKFHFDVQPVGVKLLAERPDTPDRLTKKMAFCEMLRHSMEGHAFYADVENHTCPAGPYVLGQAEGEETFVSGRFGAGLGIYEEPRAASRLYQHIPTIRRGVVNYVVFSPLDRLSYNPDLVVLLTNTSQAEILLRAMSYRTGQPWLSKYSSAIGCSWLFIHPYLTGELNYVSTGLGHGVKRRKLFPEGLQLISIPADILPSMLQTLREMPWVLPAYEPDGLEFVRKLLLELGVGPPED